MKELSDFVEKVANGLSKAEQEVEFCAEPKLDGLALSLIYKNGVLVTAATRGNGRIGENVTAQAKTIKNIPLSLKGDKIPSYLEVRGEVFMLHRDFEAANEFFRKRDGIKAKLYANPRNAAAGALRQLAFIYFFFVVFLVVVFFVVVVFLAVVVVFGL